MMKTVPIKISALIIVIAFFISPASAVISINVPPIADAGLDQSVDVGDLVTLDGSGSSDEDGDSLIYHWEIVLPPGSSAELSDPTAVQTTFTPDVGGTYETSLVVNDGLDDSEPDTVIVTATATATVTPDAVIEKAKNAIVTINGLDSGDFRNPYNQQRLINKLNVVILLVNRGKYVAARYEFQNDILLKTDGCTKIGRPDRNDWITTCEAQAQVYPLITEMIELLEELTATDTQSEVIAKAELAIDTINDLDSGDFRNPYNQQRLTNKLNAVIQMVKWGKYDAARYELRNDILPRMDGCAKGDGPDRNDWITTCEAQDEVYPLITGMIELLGELT